MMPVLAWAHGLQPVLASVLPAHVNRLRLPQGAVGRDYILLQLKVAGKGPFDFMVRAEQALKLTHGE